MSGVRPAGAWRRVELGGFAGAGDWVTSCTSSGSKVGVDHGEEEASGVQLYLDKPPLHLIDNGLPGTSPLPDFPGVSYGAQPETSGKSSFLQAAQGLGRNCSASHFCGYRVISDHRNTFSGQGSESWLFSGSLSPK